MNKLLKAGLLILPALALINCGGGSGGDSPGGTPASTISGTAAAGAPISGTVTIKDSSSPAIQRTTTINPDGSYSLNTAGMTPPFMLRAQGTVGGKSYLIHSAATAADINGTVNVTPLTDLIIANIAADVAADYFDSGNFSGITPGALATAETNLQTRLTSVLTALGVNAAVDLLRTSFSADHTGLDAALDVLQVTVDPATAEATILNVINNQQIVDDLQSQADTSALPATNTASGAVSTYQMIVDNFDTFAGLFATSLPAANNATLLGLFVDDGSFKLDGANLTDFLAMLTSDDALIGLRFNDITVLSMDNPEAPTELMVRTMPSQASDAIVFKFVKVGSAWKNAGNQRIAQADSRSFARREDDGSIDTGLEFNVKDEMGTGIDYAVAKGTGLPAEGLLLVNGNDGNSFFAAQAPYSGSTTTPLLPNGRNQYPLADATIGTIADTEAYTIELWDDKNTPNDVSDDAKVATYTNVLNKRPYLSTELSAGAFADITTAASAIGSFAASGGSLTVNWALPAGKSANSLHFWRSYGSSQDSADDNLTATATSSGLTMPAPTATVQGAGLNLHIIDVYHRELTTIKNGQLP